MAGTTVLITIRAIKYTQIFYGISLLALRMFFISQFVLAHFFNDNQNLGKIKYTSRVK